MNVAAGNIRVLAGQTPTLVVNGLDFTPARITARASSPTSFAPSSRDVGIFSTDKPESGDFPQHCTLPGYVQTNLSRTTWRLTRLSRVFNLGTPSSALEARISSVGPGSFTIIVVSNTLPWDAIISWIATGEALVPGAPLAPIDIPTVDEPAGI